MNSVFVPFVVLWSLLAAGVLALFFWRQTVSREEDDTIHMLHNDSAPPVQMAVAHKLDVIDKWGKILTVITVVAGLLIAAAYMYESFAHTSSLGS